MQRKLGHFNFKSFFLDCYARRAVKIDWGTRISVEPALPVMLLGVVLAAAWTVRVEFEIKSAAKNMRNKVDSNAETRTEST